MGLQLQQKPKLIIQHRVNTPKEPLGVADSYIHNLRPGFSKSRLHVQQYSPVAGKLHARHAFIETRDLLK